MAEGGLGLSLPTIDEPDVDPSGQDTDARLQGIVKEKERLTARLKRLNSSLDEIQAEETDIVGDDMTELVAELGEDSDLKQILDTIKLSAEEISSVEDSIRQIAAEGEELERQGVDFRQRYGAEWRVTKGMELILASQQVRGCAGWRMRGGEAAGGGGCNGVATKSVSDWAAVGHRTSWTRREDTSASCSIPFGIFAGSSAQRCKRALRPPCRHRCSQRRRSSSGSSTRRRSRSSSLLPCRFRRC